MTNIFSEVQPQSLLSQVSKHINLYQVFISIASIFTEWHNRNTLTNFRIYILQYVVYNAGTCSIQSTNMLEASVASKWLSAF